MKGRFAPTPSGRMHLGNIFVALLAWLSARNQHGAMLLRVEDLDLQRTSPDFTRYIIDDMQWLGLSWDEGPPHGGPTPPYLQSRRGDIYEKCLKNLAEKQRVYPCFCSRAQLHSNAASAPHLSDGNYLYSGTCRQLTPEEVAEKSRQRSPALRLMVPDETIEFEDGCQGAVRQNLARECGDFILRRSDGVWAYQLAAPVDDGLMGVTEVVRGRDLLFSTPRQIWLLRTLGYPIPRYCHTPLLLAPDGRRLAKRDLDLDMGVLREKCTPEQLTGKLAHLAGLLPRYQPIAPADLIPLFSWDKIRPGDITITADFYKGF